MHEQSQLSPPRHPPPSSQLLILYCPDEYPNSSSTGFPSKLHLLMGHMTRFNIISYHNPLLLLLLHSINTYTQVIHLHSCPIHLYVYIDMCVKTFYIFNKLYNGNIKKLYCFRRKQKYCDPIGLEVLFPCSAGQSKFNS